MYRFPSAPRLPRPLLSQIAASTTKRKQLSEQLQAGYRKLAENDRTYATQDRGYRREVYTHRRFCNGGSADVHNTWLFLPWHRAFLYFHEHLLQTLIGDSTFRLPVWDWESLQGVPSAYEGWDRPIVKKRTDPGASEIANAALVQSWLSTGKEEWRKFIGYDAAAGIPASQASGGPHAAIHSRLGGFMQTIEDSPADPLFFAHHANLDRWFQIWLNRFETQFKDREDWKNWIQQTIVVFNHLRPQPSLVSVSIDDLLHKNMGYCYDVSSAPQLPNYSAVKASTSDPVNFIDTFDLASLASAFVRMVSATPEFLSHLLDGSTLSQFVREVRVNLPLVFGATLRESDEPGFYRVAFRRVVDGKTIRVGGFGVFSSNHGAGMHDARSVEGTFSISPQQLPEFVSLLTSNQLALDFQMIYAREDPSNRGAPIPANALVLQLRSLELRFPA